MLNLPNGKRPGAWSLAYNVQQTIGVAGGILAHIIAKDGIVCGSDHGRYSVSIGVQYAICRCGCADGPPFFFSRSVLCFAGEHGSSEQCFDAHDRLEQSLNGPGKYEPWQNSVFRQARETRQLQQRRANVVGIEIVEIVHACVSAHLC